MAIPYKFLTVKDHHKISEQMFAYIHGHSGLLVSDVKFWTKLDINTVLHHVPSLKKLLKRNALTPIQISVIIVDPDKYEVQTIHADLLQPHVRILWPVKNCAGSRTKFYHIPNDFMQEITSDDVHSNSNDTYYVPTVERDWRFLTEFELTSPLVFDASIAHAVNCVPRPYAKPAHTDWFRISFTIAFDQSLPISKRVSAWPDSLN
jgi:hypothetical protein